MAWAGGLMLAIAFLLLVWGQRRKSGAPAARTFSDESADSEDAPKIVAIEDAIDLHGFQPRDVVSVVESYLEAAHEHGFTEVRLIHGRGKGVQRSRVQQLLEGHPLVERYADAPAHRGGWGATIAWLRPKGTTPEP